MAVSEVIYDLKNSKFNLEFNEYGIILYFSTEFNKNRFLKNYNDYLLKEKSKFNTLLKIENIEIYFIIDYYTQIEKRGFCVQIGCEIYDNIEFIINVK